MSGINPKDKVKHRLEPSYGVGIVQRVWPDGKRADVLFKEYHQIFKNSIPNAGKGHFLISNLEVVNE